MYRLLFISLNVLFIGVQTMSKKIKKTHKQEKSFLSERTLYSLNFLNACC